MALRAIWQFMDRDVTHKIPWNKYHIPPLRKPRGFSRQSYRSSTGKCQRHSERITCRRPLQWALNVWDNVPMDLEYVFQQYFTCTCMCFLGFIRYNKTFYDFYFMEYDSCPVWSCDLIFTHCPIKLIYL
jgi:hypothetical protein